MPGVSPEQSCYFRMAARVGMSKLAPNTCERLMQQAHDFRAECDALARVLQPLSADDWETPTQFKGWTINDVIVHLHFWNRAADLSLQDPNAFRDLAEQVMAGMAQGGMRTVENRIIAERGTELFDAWQTLYRDMEGCWAAQDPKARMVWVGPDMSARSMMTARQMETWAHGQEIFDVLGQEQPQTDRIRNVVILGVNTFGWSHQVHGLPVPDAMPRLILTAPSGEIWTFGPDAGADTIEGSAVEFAQVVAQTRNIADTQLRVVGDVASRWMAIAQCFAGQPETPPAPGARFRISAP